MKRDSRGMGLPVVRRRVIRTYDIRERRRDPRRKWTKMNIRLNLTIEGKAGE